MEAEFTHGRVTSIDHTPSGAAVEAGDIIVAGEETRIAHGDIADGQLGSLAVPAGGGIYKVPKATAGGSGIADGVKVYWDAAAGEAQEDAEAGANKPLGFTVGASADADTHLFVRHATW